MLLTPADLALVLAVSCQATLLAYLREPRWKAALFALPIPFTMATLSLGRPVGATNVLALPLLYLYTEAVRRLHGSGRVPIVPAILLAAAGYTVVGMLLAQVVPSTEAVFWLAAAAVFCLGLGLFRRLPPRAEPGHRSPLPVWAKLPIITAVILFLVTIKQTLGGFMTLFPMMGVVTAYEARHSLWTISRQIPLLMIALVPMMAVCRLAQPAVGLGASLALGWGVYLAIYLPMTRADWARAGRV
jgi:hypothetical protein